MTPKVDTFEHDIADEIRRKEASLAEIQAVSKQNSPNLENIPQKKLPWMTIILAILLVVALLGIGGVTYYYFNSSILPPSAQEMKVETKDIPKMTAELSKLSPTLAAETGRFVSGVEKKETGYILTINNYSAVFGYMTRNENSYIDELALLFYKGDIVASSTPVIQDGTSTSQAIISTSTASTTTVKNITKPSTTSYARMISPYENHESSTTETQPTSPFIDMTYANQNMRVYKKDKHDVVYAFVGDKTVLISDTPEGILALRSAILR